MKQARLVVLVLLNSARKDWTQVLFTLIAIIVGSAGLSAVLVLNNAAQSEYQSLANNAIGLPYDIAAIISAQQPTKNPVTKDIYSQLRNAGVSSAIAFSQIDVQLDNSQTKVTLIGVDAPALAIFANQLGDPLGLVESMLVTSQLHAQIKENGLAPLSMAFGIELPQLPIAESSIKPAEGGEAIILDLYYFTQILSVAKADAKLPYELKIAILGPNAPIEQVNLLLPEHFEIKTLFKPIDPASVTQSLHLNLIAMSIVMFIVCFFIVVNALNLLILGRTRTFKTLRQLGVERRKLILAQSFELVLYAIVGGLVGVFAGHFLAVALAPALALTLAGLYNINIGFMHLNTPHLALPIVAVCIVSMLLAASLPYRQLNRSLSRQKFESDLDSNSSRASIVFVCILLVSISVSVWLWFSGNTLPGAFFMLGCVVISGIAGLFWLYPCVIRKVVAIAESWHPVWHWSFAHSLIVANKTKLASAAFMIALVTHIGMNLMVGSFRDATNTWLEQRLVGNFYVYGDSESIQTVRKTLQDNNIRAFARYQIDTQFSIDDKTPNLPIRVYSYPFDQNYQKAMLTETISDNAWQSFEAQQGVFINQQFALRHNVMLNDAITMNIDGTPNKMFVKAIYMDYGNPFVQALVSPAMLKATGSTRVMSVHTEDRANTEALLANNLTLYSRDDILKVSMQAFDRTFLITDALNIVTLLVAVFSLTTSIILLEQKSRYVNALMRSFGVSRRRFTAALFSQYGLLCLITAIWAIPFGIAFAWLLVTQVNVFAFQWQFPFIVQTGPILMAIFISLALVLSLAAIPIVKRKAFSISGQLTCKD